MESMMSRAGGLSAASVARMSSTLVSAAIFTGAWVSARRSARSLIWATASSPET